MSEHEWDHYPEPLWDPVAFEVHRAVREWLRRADERPDNDFPVKREEPKR